MSLLTRIGRRRQPISCRELVELVTDYLEGEMPARERERLERHLAACPHCTAYLQQLRCTLAELGELHEADLDTPVGEELLVAFRDWKAASP